jgi:hypothetical protein
VWSVIGDVIDRRLFSVWSRARWRRTSNPLRRNGSRRHRKKLAIREFHGKPDSAAYQPRSLGAWSSWRRARRRRDGSLRGSAPGPHCRSESISRKILQNKAIGDSAPGRHDWRLAPCIRALDRARMAKYPAAQRYSHIGLAWSEPGQAANQNRSSWRIGTGTTPFGASR